MKLAIAIVIAACMSMLALAQGGFFGLATCACGLLVTVLAVIVCLRASGRKQPLSLVPFLFLGMTLAYLLSALVNGVSLTTLSEAGVWASCAGFSLLASAQEQTYRSKTLFVLAWCGVALSVLAVCVYVGVLPLEDGVLDGRLQFTFQYANTMAAWFGACTFLCLLGADARVRSFAAFPIATMLLSQSAGALVAFLVVAVLVGVWLGRKGAWGLLLGALVQGLLGILLFAATIAIASVAVLPVLFAAGIACFMLYRHAEDLAQRVDSHKATIVATVLLVVAVIVAVWALPDRIQQAHYGLAERMYQVRDGLALWLGQPLLGRGPDNWQYLFPYIQTAPYRVAVVHSSYVQILDDAGVLGLGFLVAACVLGVLSLARGCKSRSDSAEDSSLHETWLLSELATVVFILLHSILDFDLQFGAMAFLLAFLLSGPRVWPNTSKVARGLVGGIATAAVCVPLCLVGLYCSASTVLLARANAAKDYQAAERLFWTNPFALADPSAQAEYVAAQFGKGDYSAVVEAYELMAAPSDDSVVRAATAWQSLDRPDQATATFIKRLKATPYSENLINEARVYAQSVGVDPPQQNEFDAALGKATSLVDASELSTLREK